MGRGKRAQRFPHQHESPLHWVRFLPRPQHVSLLPLGHFRLYWLAQVLDDPVAEVETAVRLRWIFRLLGRDCRLLRCGALVVEANLLGQASPHWRRLPFCLVWDFSLSAGA